VLLRFENGEAGKDTMAEKRTTIPGGAYSGYAFSASPWRNISPELLQRAAVAIAFTADEGRYPLGGFRDIGYGVGTETPTHEQLVKEYGEQAASDIADLIGIER